MDLVRERQRAQDEAARRRREEEKRRNQELQRFLLLQIEENHRRKEVERADFQKPFMSTDGRLPHPIEPPRDLSKDGRIRIDAKAALESQIATKDRRTKEDLHRTLAEEQRMLNYTAKQIEGEKEQEKYRRGFTMSELTADWKHQMDLKRHAVKLEKLEDKAYVF